MTVGSLITTVKSGMETLLNPDASGMEKLGAIIGMVSAAVGAFNTV
jgi:hypothetical protein